MTTAPARPDVRPAAPAPTPRRAGPRRRPRRAEYLRGTAIVVAVAVVTLPLVWMIAAAFKTNVQVTDPGTGLLFTPTLDNFAGVLSGGDIPAAMLNSLIVGVASTAASVLLAVPGAWAVGRFAMHGFGSLVLAARVVPAISLLVPWYYLFAQVGLVGTHLVLVLSHMFVSVPLILWIMISFFQGLPVELEEAGQVDGLSPFGSFLRISLPLAAPGIATASMLAFVASWNNFLFALVLADDDTETLPVSLFTYISYASTDWGGLMAAATVTTVPVVAVALLAQKHIVAGLTAGATKG